MNVSMIAALLVASVSAVGNALFAFGQKRSEVAENPFIFLLFALTTCILLILVTLQLFPKENALAYLTRNFPWVIISGVGFFLTFIGFYFLYTRFGTSYYVLYAVLSIISTSIFVGIVIFHEPFNGYHLLAVFCAILTIVFYAIGQHRVPQVNQHAPAVQPPSASVSPADS